MKKHSTKKFKNEDFKLVCIVKFLKLLHKHDKLLHSLKFNKSKETLEILQDKNKLSETILLDNDVIIPDPNTMKSNAMASSSSQCPSSMEATIPKSIFHGH